MITWCRRGRVVFFVLASLAIAANHARFTSFRVNRIDDKVDYAAEARATSDSMT